MSGRARLATGIIALWIVALGWQVKRLYFRPITQIVAQAARTLPPGTSYYRVYQGDRQVGWAQSQVDTLPSAGASILPNAGPLTSRTSEFEVGNCTWFRRALKPLIFTPG